MESHDSVIARLGAADIDDVLHLWEEAGLPAKPLGRDSRPELVRQLALDNLAILGLRDPGGRLSGVVLATHDGRKGWINRLAVLPGLRGRGLGTSLVRAAEAWLESSGIRIFAGLVEQGNDLSHALFASAGYVPFEGITYYTRRLDPSV